ncbi:glutamate--tRNA ligase [Weeksellaceae bacterium KMM 9724]|uniref:glutamate--tRNA ligase n=1 Tax=Profundicola chukchiensis TaxID=2961959 RepID=UPI0024390DCA|nr:glutamate--tRNA ligase [Profundicola chukchiensis]MDG4950001.1 glutamate--tRNA ligase [Profundicola chukchiensis]
MSVRVRFAPSPTGPLHMGGVRTALFNYLFAKKHKGTFVLRIEDTDQNRYVEGAEEYIKEALEWCGLIPDEGPGYGGDYAPYRQSDRKEIYQKYVQELIDSGNAYYAFDTQEDLDKLRSEAESEGRTFIYNYTNRLHLRNSLNLSAEETQALLDSDTPHVIRFKIHAGETFRLHDIIRGNISVDTSTLDDKILMKNDGMPTYHLANIVDDHEMAITHVIRGEEWLPSLPLHLLMYDAFDWTPPQFAHLPLILKSEGKGKLSKRDGDKHGFPVFPLEWKTEDGVARGYREDGYFPDAFINMLALLGWNPGTEQEIFSLEELSQAFDLNKVNNSGARFNPDKTTWFNHQYLQQKSDEELTASFQSILKEKGIETNTEFDQKIVSLLKERANFVSDMWTEGEFFYQAPSSYDEKSFKKVWKEDTKDILNKFLSFDIPNYDSAEEIQAKVKDFVKDNEIGFGKIMMPLRVALVGGLHGPDIPVIMSLLGKEEVKNRLDSLISFSENK